MAGTSRRHGEVPGGFRIALALWGVVGGAGCGDSAGPDDPAPVGLTVAGGQNAAFPGDTFSLHTWFLDSGGAPLGVRPDDVRWTSSSSGVVEHLGDSLFVARSVGSSTLAAEVVGGGATFSAMRDFNVVPPLNGRLAWGRQSGLLQPVRLVSRDLSAKAVTSAPPFGHPNAPHANAALSADGRTIAVQAARSYSDIAPPAIYLIDVTTSAVVAFTDSMPGNQIAPRWSADGEEVLFASDAGGSWNIWSKAIGGGQPRVRLQLNDPMPVVFDIARSDSGVVVRLTDVQAAQDRLWEARLDGAVVRRITDGPSTGPRVSPDGQMIAYTGTPDDPEAVFAAFLSPRAGGVPQELLPRIRVPGFPRARTNSFVAPSSAEAWSRDGAFVLVTWLVDAAYVPAGGGVSENWAYLGELYAVSADGRFRVRLTSWPWADVQADLR